MGQYFFYEDAEREDLGGGVSRKVLANSEKLMMVEVAFEKGGVGAPHTHPHEQVTYIVSGKFAFENGGVKKVVAPGDSIHFEPDVLHGTVCLEAGKLLDIFTPRREEFLKK